MRRHDLRRLNRELESYLEALTADEHLPRKRSMALYVTGLLLDGDRKSIEASGWVKREWMSCCACAADSRHCGDDGGAQRGGGAGEGFVPAIAERQCA